MNLCGPPILINRNFYLFPAATWHSDVNLRSAETHLRARPDVYLPRLSADRPASYRRTASAR